MTYLFLIALRSNANIVLRFLGGKSPYTIHILLSPFLQETMAPNIDYSKIPAMIPPPGVMSNFANPESLAPLAKNLYIDYISLDACYILCTGPCTIASHIFLGSRRL